MRIGLLSNQVRGLFGYVPIAIEARRTDSDLISLPARLFELYPARWVRLGPHLHGVFIFPHIINFESGHLRGQSIVCRRTILECRHIVLLQVCTTLAI